MCGVNLDNQGIYDFNTPAYQPQYGNQTETTEVTEEEYDGDGKLVSRKVTKTTKTYPNNSWQQPWVTY